MSCLFCNCESKKSSKKVAVKKATSTKRTSEKSPVKLKSKQIHKPLREVLIYIKHNVDRSKTLNSLIKLLGERMGLVGTENYLYDLINGTIKERVGVNYEHTEELKGVEIIIREAIVDSMIYKICHLILQPDVTRQDVVKALEVKHG